MMDYKNYTVNDFIQDEMFQRWTYTPDPESDAYWFEVLEKNPDLCEPVEEAKRFLLLFNFKNDDAIDARIGGLRKKITQAIGVPGLPSVKTEGLSSAKLPEKRYNKNISLYMAAAASVTILLVASYFFLTPLKIFLYSHKQEKVTPKGSRTVITLDDGTQVWLNADSKLTYPDSFAEGNTREVTLEGEGYFDVAEDASKPFIVHTAAIRIRVLGTSFNVRSYGGDDQVRTTLVKGKVVIESSTDGAARLTLLPRQQAVFEKRSRKITLENKIDTEPFTSWREGKLYFDEEPFSVIIDELERWYNVTIHVEDTASLSCHFSAKIHNKTLEEVLELFKASDAIDYRIQENEVFITGKLCDE